MHLYLHIPFCRQACHYCDFHFSTSQKNRAQLVEAMMIELELRKDELPGTKLDTIYFGGGTPSLLSEQELKFIFDSITKQFTIAEGAEITLEANPDDLSADYLRLLRSVPVNRLSIGIQSFRDEDLQLMNRVHSAAEGKAAVKRAQDAGFGNLTLDLIYGIPGLSDADWQQNLSTISGLGVPHLSAYCLTVEPRTALAHLVKTGKVSPVDEEQSARQFLALAEFAAANGFQHYEISNFAKEGFIAKHNSSYWFGEPYLGIGPSAHSFHGKTRRWNIANNAQYMKRIMSKAPAYEEETLSETDQFNEYVMTRLRTQWGLGSVKMNERFGKGWTGMLFESAKKWIRSGDLEESAGILRLTRKGKFISDAIAADLFR
jgi:oxygen-independent coproporphyrinogen-3 oxidase